MPRRLFAAACGIQFCDQGSNPPRFATMASGKGKTPSGTRTGPLILGNTFSMSVSFHATVFRVILLRSECDFNYFPRVEEARDERGGGVGDAGADDAAADEADVYAILGHDRFCVLVYEEQFAVLGQRPEVVVDKLLEPVYGLPDDFYHGGHFVVGERLLVDVLYDVGLLSRFY